MLCNRSSQASNRRTTRTRPRLGAAFHVALWACLVAGVTEAQDRQQIPWPQPIDLGIQTLEVREWEQMQNAHRIEVDHDFRYTDRVGSSGIDFEHHVVDDAGKTYKPVHYDHGSGLALADVDGDSLLDLYFVNQLGQNALYKNLGDGKFRDVTQEAGVAMAGRIQVSASFGDVDNDGDADLFTTTVRGGNALLLNDGSGRFRDATREAGLEYSGHSSGAVFFDYDRDGHLDLFLCNVGQYTTQQRGNGGYYIGYVDAFQGHLFDSRAEQSILYRNRGDGTFEDVSEQVGLTDVSWSGDAVAADFNDDGFPDLYVLSMQGDDHYYENQGGERFVDRTAERFPQTPWGTMGVEVLDYDNDGRLDLFLTDMHSDMSREVTPGFERIKSRMTWSNEDYLAGGENNIFGNALFHNLGEGRFEEVSDDLGVENYWPWGPSAGDLNADGWDDLFIASSMNFPYRYGVNSVLLNDRGKGFADSAFLLGVEPRAEFKKPWFDLECGGEDARHFVCRFSDPGPVTVLGNLGSRGAALVDLDGDGDLDILTQEFNSPPQVLISDLAQRRPIRWIEIALRGAASNRNGVGALVTVASGGSSQTKLNDGKSGYLSQSVMPLYFGLGASGTVDSVRVIWPSGREQLITEGLQVGKQVVIEESDG